MTWVASFKTFNFILVFAFVSFEDIWYIVLWGFL